MATIPASKITGSGQKAVTTLVLGASDDFVYNANARAVLYLDNVTGGALTPLIVGDAATSAPCPGVGDVDTSGGFQLTSVGAGDVVAIPLDSISQYLKGNITITGADAMKASILEFA